MDWVDVKAEALKVPLLSVLSMFLPYFLNFSSILCWMMAASPVFHYPSASYLLSLPRNYLIKQVYNWYFNYCCYYCSDCCHLIARKCVLTWFIYYLEVFWLAPLVMTQGCKKEDPMLAQLLSLPDERVMILKSCMRWQWGAMRVSSKCDKAVGVLAKEDTYGWKTQLVKW